MTTSSPLHVDPEFSGNPARIHDGPDYDGHVWRANVTNTHSVCRRCFVSITEGGARNACEPVRDEDRHAQVVAP